jgi:integrase
LEQYLHISGSIPPLTGGVILLSPRVVGGDVLTVTSPTAESFSGQPISAPLTVKLLHTARIPIEFPCGVHGPVQRQGVFGSIGTPPIPARKRGKRMSRRSGQNPSVRKRSNRTKGVQEYFFQYWVDVPGQEERKRETEVLGPVNSMTKSEAERKKLEFITKLELNSSAYRIPSAKTFAHAVKYYREVFAPRMLRDNTFDVADGHLRNHLESDWNDVPVEHINIDSVNEWAWKKRKKGLSWTTIKNILRTMQRVLSSSSKDQRPPFSLRGLAIPERDKLQIKMKSRNKVSFSWQQAKQIAAQVQKLERLGQARKDQYAMLFILASAADTRCSELFALKPNDVDFKADTIRVDESSDQRTKGTIGECKNVAAYRTIVMHDPEGREALRLLKKYMKKYPQPDPNGLIFRSRRNTPLLETNVLHDGLHPALRALSLPKGGLQAFRRGCNRRWELSGLNPAVLRQQMGHSSEKMTALYTGQIPLEDVKAAISKIQFSSKSGNKIDVLENMENEAVA